MPSAMKIAIIDDERDMRQSISQWLALSGYDTEAFASAEAALEVLGPDYPGIVITCRWRSRRCAWAPSISSRNPSTPNA